MANVYIRSGAAGAGTGADWANAYTTLAAGFSAKAAGGSFWVSEDHAETTASPITLTSPGLTATPCFVYCVDHLGSVPPVSADLATTATISTTGANNITIAGQSAYYYGIKFQAGSAANAANIVLLAASNSYRNFKACWFVLNNTFNGSTFQFTSSGGTGGTYILLDGCRFTFGDVGQNFSSNVQDGICIFRGGVVDGTGIPSILIVSALPVTTFEGVDLSAFGSGKTLVVATGILAFVTFKDCRLGAAVTVSQTPNTTQQTVIVSRSDSSATNYRIEKYHYTGVQTVERTIVRSGGASDGTTAISWKLTTTANSKWVLPLEAIPIVIWNDTVGSSITVTVYGIWGGGAVPNNDNIWIDCEYLGASSNPQGSFISAGKADNLASGTALASDSSTWGGSTTKFKISATFTPQQKGTIYIYVKAALASSTFYIDPEAVVS